MSDFIFQNWSILLVAIFAVALVLGLLVYSAHFGGSSGE